MNEFELIAHLCRGLPTNASTRVGPGDDCAVLDLGVPGRWLLFKTDAVVEGVHFAPETDPRGVGRKALARAFSDVAAMAGTPTHALVTLGTSGARGVTWLEAVYDGLAALARQFEVAVVGGETTRTSGPTFLSVSVLGWVAADRCVLRSGARAGDGLWVTGELGGSLESGRHLGFDPRLSEARWLAETVSVHAMIDLSDGLAGDLQHVLTASGVGAELFAEAIPVSRAARECARAGGKAALAAALADGEDFELLMAVPAAEAVRLRDGWHARFPDVRLSLIGKVTAGRELRVRDRGGTRRLELDGYVHFRQP
jgi:thiamine-monophosphate kinase